MDTLQQVLSQWVGGLAGLLPLGYAFGAGMLSSVNPCGFAMLPAYLGLYLGNREAVVAPAGNAPPAGVVTAAVVGQLARALVVAGLVTAGFVVLFSGVGAVLALGGQFLIRVVPWVALALGVALVGLGLAMLKGYHLSLGLSARLAGRIGGTGQARLSAFFLFGLAFGVASLSCTLPIFLTVVGSALVVSGFTQALVQFVSYSLGMGFMLLIVTLGIALVKGTVVGAVRQVMPYFEKVSALLLLLAGGYIIYYWLVKGGLLAYFRP